MRNNSGKKSLLIPMGILFGIAVFLCSILYFNHHFYPGSEINGVNVSFQTTTEVDSELSKRAAFYELSLLERSGGREMIKGKDIGLFFDSAKGSDLMKREQNRTLWFLAPFRKSTIHFNGAFQFNEELLMEEARKLNCMDPFEAIEPRNAALVYSNGEYRIVEESYGTKLNPSRFFYEIRQAVANGETKLDLDKGNCYLNPKIRSDSEKLLNTKAAAEKYLDSRIIYTYEDGKEVVDKSEISRWIEFDEDLKIEFNKKKIRIYLYTLADHFNTVGKIRSFVTSNGKRIQVGGGDYGWSMDVKGETEELIQAILSGGTKFKEPKYAQRGGGKGLDDIGKTYVEIDLTRQHLWYYKDGVLVTHGNVVSGKMTEGLKTPEGIYILKFKVRNAVLRGEGYQAKVSYWMPFNHNIGIHDAVWRTSFGGTIYRTRGSHGCINAPYKLAETLFQNITVGIPVVCYY